MSCWLSQEGRYELGLMPGLHHISNNIYIICLESRNNPLFMSFHTGTGPLGQILCNKNVSVWSQRSMTNRYHNFASSSMTNSRKIQCLNLMPILGYLSTLMCGRGVGVRIYHPRLPQFIEHLQSIHKHMSRKCTTDKSAISSGCNLLHILDMTSKNTELGVPGL